MKIVIIASPALSLKSRDLMSRDPEGVPMAWYSTKRDEEWHGVAQAFLPAVPRRV
jgi:hypothetical protein